MAKAKNRVIRNRAIHNSAMARSRPNRAQHKRRPISSICPKLRAINPCRSQPYSRQNQAGEAVNLNKYSGKAALTGMTSSHT